MDATRVATADSLHRHVGRVLALQTVGHARGSMDLRP
jgi:hypothetical protein